MRRDPVRDHVEPHGAVAAALDAAVGRLADDREIAGEPIGMRLGHLPQTVLLGRNLLMVVEHVRQVILRVDQRGGEVQEHRVGCLHVGRAAAPHHPLAGVRRGNVLPDQRVSGRQPARREVVDHRNRVKVPGEHHAPRPAERRGRDHRVAVPVHRQVRLRPQERLYGVGQRLLVIADGIRVHDLFEQ